MNPRVRHEIFKKNCDDGQFWQAYVAMFLRGHRLPVQLNLDPIKDNNVALSPNEYEGGDIVIGNGLIVSVKSYAPFKFTCKNDYPYEDVLVEEKIRYDRRVREGKSPRVCVILSQMTGAMLWVSIKETRVFWRVSRRAKINDRSEVERYFVSKDHLHPIDELIPVLRDVVASEKLERSDENFSVRFPELE